MLLLLPGIEALHCPVGKILRGHLSIFTKCERLRDQKQVETELKKHPLVHRLLESKRRGSSRSPRMLSQGCIRKGAYEATFPTV